MRLKALLANVVRPLARQPFRVPVFLSLSIMISLARVHQRRMSARLDSKLSTMEKRAAIGKMQALVGKLPPPSMLGGEVIGVDAFRRFISVCDWDPVSPTIPQTHVRIALFTILALIPGTCGHSSPGGLEVEN